MFFFSCCFCRNEKDASFSIIFCAVGMLANCRVRREGERRESESGKARTRARSFPPFFPFLFRGFDAPGSQPPCLFSLSSPSLPSPQKTLFQAATSRAPCSSTSSPAPWTLCARGPTGRSSAPTTSSSARLVSCHFSFFLQFSTSTLKKEKRERKSRGDLFSIFFRFSFLPLFFSGGLSPSLPPSLLLFSLSALPISST